MANTYIQFCENLVLNNDDEVRWVKHHLEVIDKVESSDDPELHPDYYEAQRMSEDLYHLDDCEPLGFQWSIYDGPGSTNKTLYIYSDESGNIEHAATFVLEYLTRFASDRCFSFSWSDTCSESRPGEFGGGSVFITVEKTEWFSSWDWLHKRKKAFAKKQKAQAGKGKKLNVT